MLKKIVIFLVIVSNMVACSSTGSISSHGTNNELKIESSPDTSKLSPSSNGWAPVFFSSLDKTQLSAIADGINQHQIRRTTISYPTKMQTLANQIQQYLQINTNQTVPMTTVELKDTDQVKYNLKQVIVTLYF